MAETTDRRVGLKEECQRKECNKGHSGNLAPKKTCHEKRKGRQGIKGKNGSQGKHQGAPRGEKTQSPVHKRLTTRQSTGVKGEDKKEKKDKRTWPTTLVTRREDAKNEKRVSCGHQVNPQRVPQQRAKGVKKPKVRRGV